MNNQIQIEQDAPLNRQDTEVQTFGCRHSNPSICKSHSVPFICAFVTKDGICKLPPRSWKQIYKKLIKNK